MRRRRRGSTVCGRTFGGDGERVWVNVPLNPGLSVKWALSDLLFAAMSVTAVRKVRLRRAEVLS